MVTTRYIWLRVGDGGDYAMFEDLDHAIDHLNELGVGRVEGWVSSGFVTPNYWGNDYISCYWGDDGADMESLLLPDEQAYIEDRLVESFL